jgi:hypothetical protein
MTVPRLLLLLVAGVLFADYRYGDGRLINTLSDRATQLIYKLNDELSKLERRVAPSHQNSFRSSEGGQLAATRPARLLSAG